MRASAARLATEVGTGLDGSKTVVEQQAPYRFGLVVAVLEQ